MTVNDLRGHDGLWRLNLIKHSNDGPIIAVQIENEYGVYEQDSTYLPALRQILIEGGITEVSHAKLPVNKNLAVHSGPLSPKTVHFESAGTLNLRASRTWPI